MVSAACTAGCRCWIGLRIQTLDVLILGRNRLGLMRLQESRQFVLVLTLVN